MHALPRERPDHLEPRRHPARGHLPVVRRDRIVSAGARRAGRRSGAI